MEDFIAVLVIGFVIMLIVSPMSALFLLFVVFLLLIFGINLFINTSDGGSLSQNSQANPVSYGTSHRINRAPRAPHRPARPRSQTYASRRWHNVSPNIFFHGTTRDIGIEICRTNLWLASEDKKGIWMGNTIDIAREFAGKDGAIIAIEILHPLKPQHPSAKPKGYYVLQIPNGKPSQEYYHVPGIRIIALLDSDGRKLL